MFHNNTLLRLALTGKKLALWTVATSFIAIAVDIAIPLFNQVFTDSIITRRHPEWIEPMGLLLAAISIGYLLTILVTLYHKRRMQLKFLINTAATFVWHALRLPVSALQQFNPAEILNRYNKGYTAAISISFNLIDIIVRSLQIIIMLTIMIVFSPVLSLVSIVSFLMNITMVTFINKHQLKLSKERENYHCDMNSTVVAGINNIELVKAAGAEDSYFRKSMDKFARWQEYTVRMDNQMIFFSMVPQVLINLTTVITLCIGAMLIISGNITVGILVAFQSLLGQFMLPLTTLINGSKEMAVSSNLTQRYYGVMDSPTDVTSEVSYNPDETLYKLQGQVELRNITFGYDRSQPPLIRNLSLTIKPGQSLGLVGGSGSGKSTIASLIAGLYEPWEGEILFDGKQRKDINRYVFYNSVAVINQDITLFEGTVADNIRMWDSVTEDFSIVMAAEAAQIHNDIVQRPDGYSSLIQNSGSNFSGGQRQRIEIATALAKEPMLLIMDEATAALDPATEAKVMDHIRQQGITTIVVAHRLSTVRDCEEILVIDKGRIDGRGTHDELMKQKDGLYYKLMQMN